MDYAAATSVKRVVIAVLGWLFMAAGFLAQTVDPGRKAFESRCARCHGADGNGGERGPAIAVSLTTRDDPQLTSLIRDGLPGLGMPPGDVPDPAIADLLKFLRTIQRRADTTPSVRMTLQTTAGRTLDGQVLGEGFADLQLLSDDKQVHLLRRAGDRFREVTSEVDWPTYNGNPGGNRYTGELLWDTALDNWRKNYSATSAPLPAGDLIISGVTGGEHGANGFVAAHDQETGKEVWRFSTVPKPGAPGSETWHGKDIEHGGAPTWFTGSYDPALDTIYWPTGNPAKEYNGVDRQGDNLYSDSILALDRKTGALRWYYQFTPHDLWDWDATQTSVLVDADWQGRPRLLMLHASRNGFFYVFDRRDGTLLLAKPFVKNLTWASGIGPDGRPVKLPNQEPTPAGTRVCPSQDGATNWFSPSFSPGTGLYYVQTFEKCSIYTRSDQGEWESGKSYLGGSQRTARDPKPQRILKAIDIRTGAIRWEVPQTGPADSWGGTLTTASGLVIFGEDGGGLVAADAGNGKPLWIFQTNHTWKASPMTYMFDGTQYVAVAAGSNIIALAIQD